MTSVPIPAEALATALAPFGEGTMLPAQAYTSDEVLAWERRHVFAASWLCLGHENALRVDGNGRPVTQRGVMAGDVPVMLTFGDGGVRVFANTCRHRGHEILADGQTADKRALMCPYHAWSYNLAGELIAAPGFAALEGFDTSAYPLTTVPVEVWHGWVFVNATGDAADFQEHLGDLAGVVAPYAPGSLRLLDRHTYEVATNWKVICENYHECYHCPMIHPELCEVTPPNSGENWDLPGAWVGGTMELRDHADTMSMDGKSAGRLIPGVDPRKVVYVGLFPNLLLSLHPDYVMAHRIMPIAPGRTWIECAWYFPEGVEEGSYAVNFWDLTNRQDWAACESVQRGLESPHFKPGPLAPNEEAVYQWITMVGRAYTGGEPHDIPVR
jgi:Rieske 2Fe-2S family protein